jgi:hypothetical protein
MQIQCSEQERREQMTRTGYFLRLGLSILIDLGDFTFGRIPILGTAENGVSGIAVTAIWGRVGLFYFLELLDLTDQINALIPSATLIGLYVGWREGHLGAPKRDVPAQQP